MGRSLTNLAEKQQRMRDRHSPAPSVVVPLQSPFAERHYAPAEVAEMWKLSQDVVRRVFQNEPGVLALASEGSRRTRPYTTLRIPESVLQHVHRRLSKV